MLVHGYGNNSLRRAKTDKKDVAKRLVEQAVSQLRATSTPKRRWWLLRVLTPRRTSSWTRNASRAVYMMASANKLLRIYYATVKQHLDSLEA